MKFCEENLTWGQYRTAEGFFLSYLKSHKIDDLKSLWKCLIPQDRSLIPLYFRKNKLLLDYGRFRMHIHESYPNAFKFIELADRLNQNPLLIYELDSINLKKCMEVKEAWAKLWFANKARPVVFTWMFLDPVELHLPKIVKISEHEILFNGTLLNPLNN